MSHGSRIHRSSGAVAYAPRVFHRPPIRMHMHQHRTRSAVLFTFLALAANAGAQCLNSSQYPANTTVPLTGGQATTISTCNWQSEYAVITGIVPGASYAFAYEGGAWVTVRQGAYNGAVVGQGPSPLTVEASTGQDLFAHWNTDSLCGTAQVCHISSVQLLDPGCDPPVAAVSVVDDCDAQQFSVDVEVQSTGDASSIGIAWTVNGGTPSNLGGLQAGTYTIGPFSNGVLVQVTVMHAENPGCNVALNAVTSGACAIMGCGPETYTYCYPNNANLTQSFQGDGGYPLHLVFNSGMVTNTGNDPLTIHDGLSPLDPVLFSGVGNNGNLAGVSVTSTNPDHALTIRFTSNGSFSCGDGGISPEWNYTVSCLDCTLPSATGDSVVTDCASQSFTVMVDVTDLGSADTLLITNNAGLPPAAVTATGAYVAGPFPVGTPVALSLVNTTSANCTVALGTFISGFCPLLIDCDGPLLQQSYCYGELDTEEWLYQSSGTSPLAIVFSAGSIESASWDHLTIHDGEDQTAPVLYDHVVGGTVQLAGLTIVGTGPTLYMRMTSDGSISCAGGNMATWVWTVGCIDCTSPEAAFEVIPDCPHNSYSVAVNVTGLGSGDDVSITDTWSGDTLSGVGLGTTTIGPIPAGVTAHVSVINGNNAFCRTTSEGLGLPASACVITACEMTNVEHCYANADTAWFIYSSGESTPLTVYFASGQLLPGDQIRVFNGLTTGAQLVYAGNFGGDIAGYSLTSSNMDNALLIQVVSDGAGSCATGEAFPPLHWAVGCGFTGVGAAGQAVIGVFPNPTTGQVRVVVPWPGVEAVRAEVLDMMGRLMLDERAVAGADGAVRLDLGGLAGGRYALRLSTPERAAVTAVELVR